MISAPLVGSVAAGAVVAYPLVKLFPQRYWLAALLVSVPVFELRGRDLLHYIGRDEARIFVMSIVELVVYPAAIFACSWLAAYWLRSKPEAAKRQPQ